MAPDDDKKLGRQLLSALEDVNQLIPIAKPEDLDSLRKTRERLIEQIGRLVDANIDGASQEYREATIGLQAASASVQSAIRRMETVAKAIETLAKAVDLLTKVAAA